MRARSPIEMMVDKACGVTAEDLARPSPAVSVVDSGTQALMNVGDAAVAWLKQRDAGASADDLRNAERVLIQCARELAATGW